MGPRKHAWQKIFRTKHRKFSNSSIKTVWQEKSSNNNNKKLRTDNNSSSSNDNSISISIDVNDDTQTARHVNEYKQPKRSDEYTEPVWKGFAVEQKKNTHTHEKHTLKRKRWSKCISKHRRQIENVARLWRFLSVCRSNICYSHIIYEMCKNPRFSPRSLFRLHGIRLHLW